RPGPRFRSGRTAWAAMLARGLAQPARAAIASHANARIGSVHISRLRHGMRRVWVALVLALLAIAPLASAQKAIDITPDYIAGVHLGMTKVKARSLLFQPVRHDRLEDGYERYVSPRQK